MFVGGAENVSKSICTNINRKNFEISVISLYRLETDRWPKNIKYYSLCKKNRGFDFRIIARLKKILSDEKPDIIHCHSHYNLAYVIPANFFSSKSIIIQTIHNNLDFYLGQNIWGIIFKMFKIIPVNFSKEMNPKIQKIKNSKNILNGIDLKRFSISRRLGNEKKILFLGRLEKQKNPLLALDFFSELLKIDSDFRMTMIGRGSLEKHLQDKAKELSLEKKLKFIFDSVKPENFFFTHNYFLISSSWEGMPLLAMEAMAAGMIVFSMPVGAMKSIVKHKKTGFLFKSKNSEEMAKQFLNDLKNSDQFEIKKCMRKVSYNFSEKKMVDNYEKLFLESMKTRNE